MYTPLECQLALRTRLLLLAGPTTGAANLSATPTGFARAADSFIVDGFEPGMEITAAGFDATNNGQHILTAVSALTLTCAGCATLAAGAGRTISVGLPSRRSWANIDFVPVAGAPYVEEEYVPGPGALHGTMGGLLEVLPQYFVTVYAPAGNGVGALARYARALLLLFPPRQPLTLTSGDTLVVRADPAPYAGQVQYTDTGWAAMQFTIPLQLWTQGATI